MASSRISEVPWPNNVLNTYAAARYVRVGIGADAYHVLGLRYADDVEYDVSNWSVNAGTALASRAARRDGRPAADRHRYGRALFLPRRLVTTVALAVLRAGASGRPRSASSRRAPTSEPAPRRNPGARIHSDRRSIRIRAGGDNPSSRAPRSGGPRARAGRSPIARGGRRHADHHVLLRRRWPGDADEHRARPNRRERQPEEESTADRSQRRTRSEDSHGEPPYSDRGIASADGLEEHRSCHFRPLREIHP